MEPFKDHLSTHGDLTRLRNTPQQKQPSDVHLKYLPESLVNAYTYHLMVKVCLAVVCVKASFSQIRSNTYTHACMMHTVTHPHTHSHIHPCMYAHTCMHVRTHMHIHTHTHTHTYIIRYVST